MKRDKKFFEQGVIKVAKRLLGDFFVYRNEQGEIVGRIVETEAYGDATDLASHARFGNKGRSQIMFGSAGVLYVYAIYGLFDLTNIICDREGSPSAVLIRAVEIIEGDESALDNLWQHKYMKKFYGVQEGALRSKHHTVSDGIPTRRNKVIDARSKLATGPGKFSAAFGIDRSMNGTNITRSTNIYIERPKEKPKFDIIETTRVGIDYAGASKGLTWRFYIKDNKYVSKL